MDEFEIMILIVSGYFSFYFFMVWYKTLGAAWPPYRYRISKQVLGALPVAVLVILFVALRFLAAHDVVSSPLFIGFYILLGYACLHFCIRLTTRLFDLSWIDDALHMNNHAALAAFSGGMLGLALIYSGANVGEGPGWWCVIVAGALGLAAWVLLGMLVNLATNVFERITVERDLGCGIRTGAFLLASGLILARASAGDWTSARATVYEFLDGWPVLGLAVLVVLVERAFLARGKQEGREPKVAGSALLGAVYLVLAVGCVLALPPLNQNPIYH